MEQLLSDHADGSVIDIISGSRDATLPLSGDDALIASGDDFGFNEMSSFYEDFRGVFSITTKGRISHEI